MPYATGTASSAADLRTALVNFATANGWTWDSGNEMLYKAPVYAKVTVSGLQLRAQAALGYSGATLTTPATRIMCISDKIAGTNITTLSYPVTYHLFAHTAPDDLIVGINYAGVFWQWLGFGNGRALGDEANPRWQWGSSNTNMTSNHEVAFTADGSTLGGVSDSRVTPIPFWRCAYTGNNNYSSEVYCNIDGSGWVQNFSFNNSPHQYAVRTSAALVTTQPNAWNGESILINPVVAVSRASSFYSQVMDIPHLRYVRNDNLTDGQIVTLGTDKWFTAPAFRKNTTFRDVASSSGGNTYSHTGTFGLAIRYDGP